MIFIGGISSGVKQIEYTKTVNCSRCGSYGGYQVYMTYLYFSFFFIPLFKWNRRYYVRMSCCGAEYELTPRMGQKLLKGMDTEICEEDLHSAYPGEGQGRSGSRPADIAKKCRECGYETSEDFTYCPKCGNRLI